MDARAHCLARSRRWRSGNVKDQADFVEQEGLTLVTKYRERGLGRRAGLPSGQLDAVVIDRRSAKTYGAKSANSRHCTAGRPRLSSLTTWMQT